VIEYVAQPVDLTAIFDGCSISGSKAAAAAAEEEEGEEEEPAYGGLGLGARPGLGGGAEQQQQDGEASVVRFCDSVGGDGGEKAGLRCSCKQQQQQLTPK